MNVLDEELALTVPSVTPAASVGDETAVNPTPDTCKVVLAEPVVVNDEVKFVTTE